MQNELLTVVIKFRLRIGLSLPKCHNWWRPIAHIK